MTIEVLNQNKFIHLRLINNAIPLVIMKSYKDDQVEAFLRQNAETLKHVYL